MPPRSTARHAMQKRPLQRHFHHIMQSFPLVPNVHMLKPGTTLEQISKQRQHNSGVPDSVHHLGRCTFRTWSYMRFSEFPGSNQYSNKSLSCWQNIPLPLLLPLSPFRRLRLLRVSRERKTLYNSHKVTQFGECSPVVEPRSKSVL